MPHQPPPHHHGHDIPSRGQPRDIMHPHPGDAPPYGIPGYRIERRQPVRPHVVSGHLAVPQRVIVTPPQDATQPTVVVTRPVVVVGPPPVIITQPGAFGPTVTTTMGVRVPSPVARAVRSASAPVGGPGLTVPASSAHPLTPGARMFRRAP